MRKSACHFLKASSHSIAHLALALFIRFYEDQRTKFHPLRGASLRSAPRSSRQGFPEKSEKQRRNRVKGSQRSPRSKKETREDPIPQSFKGAGPIDPPKEASQKQQKMPQRCIRNEREAPQRGPDRSCQRGPNGPPREGPRSMQKRPCLRTLGSAKMYGFPQVLKQKRKPVIARTGSAPEE